MAGLTQPRCSAHKRFGDDDRDDDYDHEGDNKGEDLATHQYAMYHIVSQILKILLVMTLMILQSQR